MKDPKASRSGNMATLHRPKDRPWFVQPSTLIPDLACYSIALFVIVFQAPLSGHHDRIAVILKLRISMENLIFAILCLAMWSVMLRLTKAPSLHRDYPILILNLFRISLSTGIIAVPLALSHHQIFGHRDLAAYFMLSLSMSLLCRLALSAYCSLLRPVIRGSRTVLIVGNGPRGQHLARQLILHPDWNYKLFGFLDPDARASGNNVIGSFEDLESILSSNPIDEVVIALPIKSRYEEIQRSIAICERVGVQSRYSTDLFETLITKRRSFDKHDPSSVLLHMVHDTGLVIKRITDLVVAFSLLVALSPVLLTIAVAIKLTSKGPVLFMQQRYGFNRRLFRMYKFRTMVINAEHLQAALEHRNEVEGPVFKIKKDPRITCVGAFLRKMSLDELPQMWNVLIGDMSLVGPRPLPARDVSRFSEAWQMRRFSVAPGITGLWQVSGRSNTNFERWIQLDLDYIDRWSILLDLAIIAKTFPAVLKGNGAV